MWRPVVAAMLILAGAATGAAGQDTPDAVRVVRSAKRGRRSKRDEDDDTLSDRPLTVYVYDAGRVFEDARRELRSIFLEAGTPVQFVDCYASPGACDSAALRPYEVVGMRIVAGVPTDGASGHAAPGSKVGTVYAEQVPAVGGVSRATMLARTIAHELGHLMGLKHADHGLMRANWTHHSIAKNDARDWTFSPISRADLRTALKTEHPERP